MRQAIFGPIPAPSFRSVTLDDLERNLTRSPTVARCLIVGLPTIGILASLVFGLPLFATLMGGSFLLATALVARKALVRFTGRTLRLLVAARLMIVLVMGALLFCTSGSAWVSIVSALLLWLVSDRLLGRNALDDLGKVVRRRGALSLDLVAPNSLRSAQAMSDRAVAEPDHAQATAADNGEGRLFQTPEVPTAAETQPRRRGRAKA